MALGGNPRRMNAGGSKQGGLQPRAQQGTQDNYWDQFIPEIMGIGQSAGAPNPMTQPNVPVRRTAKKSANAAEARRQAAMRQLLLAMISQSRGAPFGGVQFGNAQSPYNKSWDEQFVTSIMGLGS